MRPSRITLNAGFRWNCRSLFFLLAILFGLGASATPASALQAGDLAVIGINLDASPQEVAIVTLADIPSGTIIKITDKGWDSTTSSFFGQGTNEGTLTWTTGTSIPRGTVYKLAIAPGSPQGAATITPANAGSTVSVTGWTQYVLNMAGDQIFIYQGPESSPTFIYGFSNQYATNPAIIAAPGQWQLDTFEPSVTNQSNLPGTLSNGTTALALTGNITNLHCDNNYYSGTQSATRDALLAAIGQTAGWSCNDTSIFDLNPGGTNFPNLFTVQSQPAYTATASAATATPAPGAANTITLTVKNSDGLADTTFSGTHNVTISGYTQAPYGSYGSFNGTALTASPNTIGVNFNNGTASVSLALNKASAQTIGFGIAGVNTPATNALVISPAAPAVNSIVRTTPSGSTTNASSVTYTATFTGPVTGMATSNFSLTTTGVSGASVTSVSGSGAAWTVGVNTGSGDGTIRLNLQNSTGLSDSFGNAVSNVPFTGGEVYSIDKTAPTVSIGAASASVTRGGPVSYTVSYTGADAITLAPADITLNRTGTANGTVGVTGTGNSTRTVTVSGITGDGTLGISIGPGTAGDTAGNSAAASSASATFTVDNTAPTVSINSPTPSVTKAGPVTYAITYMGADAITLASADITLNRTGNANGTVGVTGTGNSTRTVTVSGITGDGTLGISIGAGTASDTAGNTAAASSASATFTVDNTAPTVTISSPTPSVTKAGPVTYTITYTGADAITLAPADITLNRTGNANGTVGVTGTGNSTRTVTVSGITGDGTLGIGIGAGTASDTAGNSAAASSASATFTVDNTAPTLSISQPSAPLTKGGLVTYTVTYTGADTVTLATADITLNRTGNANGTVEVTGTGNSTRTVTVSGITGDGTLGISVGAGTASDTAGNSAAASSASATFTVDNTAPAVSISEPSVALTRGGPVTYTVSYTGADAITLSAADITFNRTGTANGTAAVSGTGNSTRTVTVSGITGDGTLGISIGAGTASDTAGNSTAASAASATFTVDNTAPTISISAPTPGVTKAGPVTYTVTYTGADTVTLNAGNVALNKTGTANATTLDVTGTGNSTRTVTISGITGDGTLGISIGAGTASDTAGNSAAASSASATFTVDNTAPTVSISAPTPSVTKGGPVAYTVSYTGADTVTLAAADIALNRTGSANGTIAVSGTDNLTRTVTVSGITGDGTLGISIGPGTAHDAAGNSAPASSASATFTVDNTAPTVSIGAPSATVTKGGPVTYTVTYTGADTVTLAPADITLNRTGTATGTVAVSGTGNSTRTVTISGITGDGTLGISIGSGTASDAAGNSAASSSASATFTVDNTGPTVSIGAPTPSLTKAGPVTYTVTYTGADAVTLSAADVTLNRTGTANGTVAVSGMGNTSRTVTISGITGDGTLGIGIGAGTATDSVGNSAAASAPSSTATVDNTAPTVSIGAATPALTKAGPVTYTVTYTGAEAVTLSAADVTINRTGTANGTVAVSGTGNSTRTVTISGITGDGTLGISIGAGTATDSVGNSATASAPSSTVTVDNTAPTASIGAPSAAQTRGGPVTYTVSYTGADMITLASANVILNRTGDANGTVSVNGTGNTARTVTISEITGNGTLGISLGSGTAVDAAGNSAAAAGPGITFTVDNSMPYLTISAPSAAYTKSGPITFTLTYTGASGILLTADNITLNRTGTANGRVSVTGRGPTTRTVTIYDITGDGTLGIRVAAGTAFDSAGHTAHAAGPSGVCVVENSAPAISISAPSALETKSCPITYTVTYSEGDTITLSATDIVLNKTGTATGTVTVSGNENNMRFVTISNISGDGTLGISIAAGTATDVVGNVAPAAGPSAYFIVDSELPAPCQDLAPILLLLSD